MFSSSRRSVEPGAYGLGGGHGLGGGYGQPPSALALVRPEAGDRREAVDAALTRVGYAGLRRLICSSTAEDEHLHLLVRPHPEDRPEAADSDERVAALEVYRKQGRLQIKAVAWVLHRPPQDFERVVTAPVYVDAVVDMGREAFEWLLAEVPRFRAGQSARMAEWFAYLDWRLKLAELGRNAFAYEAFEHRPPEGANGRGWLAFLVRGEVGALRALKDETVHLLPTSASVDPDRWVPAQNTAHDGTQLGEIDEVKPVPAQAGEPDRCVVGFSVSADRYAELMAQRPMPPTGFLTDSTIAERNQVKVQRRGLAQLRDEQAYIPQLSSLLLDLEHPWPESRGDDMDRIRRHPRFAHLTPDQREAAARILGGAPVTAIQGPPGTGKTTVIAAVVEAVAHWGWRVAVVSQSNLAVDNVLERLAQKPHVRALRLVSGHDAEARLEPSVQRFTAERACAEGWLPTVQSALAERSQRGERLRDEAQRLEAALCAARAAAEGDADRRARLSGLAAEGDAAEEALHRSAATLRAAQAEQRRATCLAEAARRVVALEDLPLPQIGAVAEALPAADAGWSAWGRSLVCAPTPAAVVEALARALRRLRDPDAPRLDAALLAELAARARAGEGAPQPELAALLAERARLSDSVEDEDLERLRAVNREVRALRAGGDAAWQDRLEALEALAAAAPGLPSLAAVRGALGPEPALAEVIEAFAAAWTRRFGAVWAVAADVSARAVVWADEAERAATSASTAVLEAERALALAEDRGAAARDALEAAHQALAGYAERWQAARSAVMEVVAGGGLAAGAELGSAALDADGLAAVEAAGAAWRDRFGAEVARFERFGPVRAEFGQRVERELAAWRAARVASEAAKKNGKASEPKGRGGKGSGGKGSGGKQTQPAVAPGEPEVRAGVVDDGVAPEVRAGAADDSLSARFLRHVNVVALTCNEAGKLPHQDQWRHLLPFDLVLVDEVSKATAPELVLPALLGRRVAFIGDPNQLPPTFRNREQSFSEAIEEGRLDPDDFRRFARLVTASLFEDWYRGAPEGCRAGLTTQFRSHPDIMRVVNTFYGGMLTAGAGTEHRAHGLTVPDAQGGDLLAPCHHAIWIDSGTDAQGRAQTEVQEGSSKANPHEVSLVVATLARIGTALAAQGLDGQSWLPPPPKAAVSLVAHLEAAARVARYDALDRVGIAALIEDGRVRIDGLPARGDARLAPGAQVTVDARRGVGVITLYGAQLRALRRALDRAQQQRPEAFAALDVRLSTVDRFQGMEAPIVLVSLVRAPKKGQPLGAFVRDFRRINVALSRARSLLVVVGHRAALAQAQVQLPGADAPQPVYREIQMEIEHMGGMCHARQLDDVR